MSLLLVKKKTEEKPSSTIETIFNRYNESISAKNFIKIRPKAIVRIQKVKFDFSPFIFGRPLKATKHAKKKIEYDAIEKYVRSLDKHLFSDIPVIELREIPLKKVKEEIYRYIKEHPGCRTSDIIINLELDPDLVLKALSELRHEDRVEARDIE